MLPLPGHGSRLGGAAHGRPTLSRVQPNRAPPNGTSANRGGPFVYSRPDFPGSQSGVEEVCPLALAHGVVRSDGRGHNVAPGLVLTTRRSTGMLRGVRSAVDRSLARPVKLAYRLRLSDG
jgi:hypothetical protein